MRRGEIRLVDFEPVRADEANKRRPAIIVSNDGANATAARWGKGVVTVVPITSSTAKVYPFQVLLPPEVTGLRRESKAQSEQVRSVAFSRIGVKIGEVSGALLEELDESLRLHLAL